MKDEAIKEFERMLAESGNNMKSTVFDLNNESLKYKKIVEEDNKLEEASKKNWIIKMTEKDLNEREMQEIMKKKREKLEKLLKPTQINIKTGDNSHGNVIVGNNNTITYSNEFDTKFLELIEAINNSNLEDKKIFISELNIHKNNQEALHNYMTKKLLSKVAEVGTIVSVIGGLFGLM